MTLTESFWEATSGDSLAQGDYLTGCPVPLFPDDYVGPAAGQSVGLGWANLIVVTQSCDLANGKARLVALCPNLTLTQLAGKSSGKVADKGYLDSIRVGRLPALHMLASPDRPDDNRDARVVDLREIHSLPVAYLARYAVSLGPRWRLRPPYLEHFSQTFARFFMRVGLPSAIPPFK